MFEIIGKLTIAIWFIAPVALIVAAVVDKLISLGLGYVKEEKVIPLLSEKFNLTAEDIFMGTLIHVVISLVALLISVALSMIIGGSGVTTQEGLAIIQKLLGQIAVFGGGTYLLLRVARLSYRTNRIMKAHINDKSIHK